MITDIHRGLHVETHNDLVRELVCPGKAHYNSPQTTMKVG
jgi:hypothetical protein